MNIFEEIEKDIESIRKRRESINKRMDDILKDISLFQKGEETITINGETHVVQDAEWSPVQPKDVTSKTSLSASDILDLELGTTDSKYTTNIRGFIHGLML